MYYSLIYVSRSRLVLPDQAGEVDRIVADSIERNAAMAVRGALIFTERHFAQILEGPEASIDALMESIDRDPRHEQVTVIERRRIERYRFPDWSLAYWGDAIYMDQQLERVLAKVEALEASEEGTDLYSLLRKLARARHRQQTPIGRRSGR